MNEHSAYTIPFEDMAEWTVVRCRAYGCDLNRVFGSPDDAADLRKRHDETGAME